MKVKGPILIISSLSPYVTRKACSDCGHEIFASPADKHCPFCATVFSSDQPNTDQIGLKASVSKELAPSVKCMDCGAQLRASFQAEGKGKVTSESIARSFFCTVCGSADLEPIESSSCASCSTDPKMDDEEEILDEEDKEDLQDEEEDTISDSLSEEELEASLLQKPEPTWMIFHQGKPVIKIKASKQPKESLAIFATADYFDFFRKRIKEVGVIKASAEFNAEIVESDVEKFVTPTDIDDAVYDKLQAHILPKFIDCANLAIEGMVRNVYGDLNAELRASFYDELKARGIDDPTVVIEAAFETSGSNVFAKIIAKAMELFHKPEDIRNELKATILATSHVKSNITDQVTDEDTLESIEVAAKLRKGNIPLTRRETVVTASTVFSSQSVANMRDKLRLGR